MKKNALILDYGLGNIESISNLLRKFKIDCEVCNSLEQLILADLLILPGVGAFGPAIRKIDELGLRAGIVQRHIESKPILGICLGFQILGKSSDEAGELEGLSLFDLETLKIQPRPVIGWQKTNIEIFNSSIKRYFFYNHSFGVFEKGKNLNKLAKIESGLPLYKIDNTIGVQFHPEKSQNAGLAFFEELLKYFGFLDD